MQRELMPIKILIPALVGVISLAVLLYFSWALANYQMNESFVINGSLILASITAGWAVGILVSPLNKDEKTEFSQLTRAVAAFASGFLLAKFSEIISVAFSAAVVFTPIGGFRLIACFTSFLVALLLMFGWRRYSFSARSGSE